VPHGNVRGLCAVGRGGKSLEVAPTFYDLRYIIGQLKKIQNITGDLTSSDLPKINPLKLKEKEKELLTLINEMEPYPSLFPGKELPAK